MVNKDKLSKVAEQLPNTETKQADKNIYTIQSDKQIKDIRTDRQYNRDKFCNTLTIL